MQKKIRVASYSKKGLIVDRFECDELLFNKNGQLAAFPSDRLKKMMETVKDDGAITITKEWSS